jgi:uncharacterized membrane-anchored protein YjiN (DUF445 family)
LSRERGKFLDEAIAKLGNFRCNVSSRKQIQSEITRRKNRNSSLVNYWSAGGAVLQKSESPFLENQANSRFVDLVSHRPGKRNKTLVNNKQVCTSVVSLFVYIKHFLMKFLLLLFVKVLLLFFLPVIFSFC